MSLRIILLKQIVTPNRSLENLCAFNPKVSVHYIRNMLLLMIAAKQIYISDYLPITAPGRPRALYSLYFDGCVPAKPPQTQRVKKYGPPRPKLVAAAKPVKAAKPLVVPARPVHRMPSAGAIAWLPGMMQL